MPPTPPERTAAPASDSAARTPTWHGGMLDRYPLRSADTEGAAWLMDHEAAAGTGPPMHVHTHEDEVCYVVDGELLSSIGGEERRLGPGMAVWLPRGVPHTFTVLSPRARYLTFGLPGGFDQFFRDAGEPAEDEVIPPAPSGPTPRLLDACERHGVRIVGPPLT